MNHRAIGAALGALLLAGCSSVVLPVPADLGSAGPAMTLEKVGIGRDGRWSLASASGRFHRTKREDQHESLGWRDSRLVGKATITGSGGALGDGATLRCASSEEYAGYAAVDVAVAPFTRGCDIIAADGSARGRMALAEVPRGHGLLATATRIGTLDLDGRHYGLRAVHRGQTTAIESQDALGYEIIREGKVVALVDLSGPKARLIASADAADRAAATLGTLALAIPWHD